MNLLRKCYDMTDFQIGHSYQCDKSEFAKQRSGGALFWFT